MYLCNVKIKHQPLNKETMETINFTKGTSKEIKGSIDYMPGPAKYLAATLSATKWFKTIRGAEKWMSNNGYHKI